MIGRLLFACLLLASSPCCQAQTGGKAKGKYEYLLYVPKDYSQQTHKYPLLIYLHGGSQRGNDLNKLKTYGLPHLVEQGREFPFIIASPQCPEGKYWSTEDWFDALYRELTAAYRIDKRSVYVTGISMGGYGAWQVAVDYPRAFAAVVPLCGGLNDSSQVCRINRVPVWTFHGTADDVIPIRETEKLVSGLQECKGQVMFTRLENEGHSIQYLYERNDIYAWMLKHKLRTRRD
ncbi:MAG: prolyl oligopeptidase family serine peptidase [Cytophagales bacterium]|nr:prolyl oligopeptidase family serine peptidase [Cytophagales bacterium]